MPSRDGHADEVALDELRCLAWVGGDGCTNDVHGMKDGVPLCEHHLDKSGFYQYPRILVDTPISNTFVDEVGDLRPRSRPDAGGTETTYMGAIMRSRKTSPTLTDPYEPGIVRSDRLSALEVDDCRRSLERVHVVCGEAGEPLRAFEDHGDAQEVIEQWRSHPARIRGSIETVDFVDGGEQ